MKIKILLLTFLTSVTIIVSCKKSNSSSSSQGNTVNGNWYFESFHAKTQSTTTYTSGGVQYQTVSVSDYTSADNAGTVNFNAGTMTGTNITYYVSSTVFATDYENGQETDTASAPFTFYLPPTNTSNSYTLVGSDSLYFPSGSFTSTSGQSGASGAKIAFSGDSVMTMSTSYSKDSSGSLYGTPATFINQATLVTTLHR